MIELVLARHAVEAAFPSASTQARSLRRYPPVGRKNRYFTQRAHKCGATRQAQVSQRRFGTLSEAETSPHRMELSVQASGAVATDYNR